MLLLPMVFSSPCPPLHSPYRRRSLSVRRQVLRKHAPLFPLFSLTDFFSAFFLHVSVRPLFSPPSPFFFLPGHANRDRPVTVPSRTPPFTPSVDRPNPVSWMRFPLSVLRAGSFIIENALLLAALHQLFSSLFSPSSGCIS